MRKSTFHSKDPSDISILSEDGIVFKDCLELWGYEAQINMVTEELGELIVAIQKWKRKPCETTVRDIASEVADVEIMLGQLEYIMEKIERKYPLHLEDMRDFKFERLKQRISNSKRELEEES